jgi:hypothetical protein
MRRSLLLAAMIGTFLATPAFADVTVRYRAILPDSAPAATRANPPTMTISADGAGQARMEMIAPGTPAAGARQPGFALITREGVTYIAANGPQAGMQIITRMDDALAVASAVARPLLQGSAREGMQQVMRQRVEIIPVGPEVVAGVQGNLYRVVMVMGETRTPPFEVVVATDPRLAPVGQQVAGLFEAMRPTLTSLLGGEPQAYMALRGLAGLGTPLRIGNQLRVESVSTDDVPDSQFALPGPVLNREQLQQMMGMMMGMMRQGQGMHPPGAPGAHPSPSTPPGNAANPH